MNSGKSPVIITALAFLLAHVAYADVVYLKNGAKFERKVDGLGDRIMIKLKTGQAVISKDQALKIEKKTEHRGVKNLRSRLRKRFFATLRMTIVDRG